MKLAGGVQVPGICALAPDNGDFRPWVAVIHLIKDTRSGSDRPSSRPQRKETYSTVIAVRDSH